MSTQQSLPSQGKANRALAALLFGTFVLGSAELLVVGVLNLIAADLQVSIPAAGALVTAYALGLAIGGPVLTALTIKLNRRTVLVGALLLFTLGVPLGTLVGQALGWRGSFTAVVGLAVIALIATLALVPSVPSTGGSAGGQAKHAFAPRVLAVLVLSFLIFAALFAPLTYLAPFLQDVTTVTWAQR